MKLPVTIKGGWPFISAVLCSSWLLLSTTCLASDQIPFPLDGSYESAGSVAMERVTADQWREIPQDVQLSVLRDKDTIELRLHIDVHATEDSHSKYTILNRMWLVKRANQSSAAASGRVEFDVYKCNRISMGCNDMGDGFCDGSQCRYSYITAKSGHQHRYYSHITWQPHQLSTMFNQTGALSVKKDDGHEWVTYKTWKNSFLRKSQNL